MRVDQRGEAERSGEEFFTAERAFAFAVQHTVGVIPSLENDFPGVVDTTERSAVAKCVRCGLGVFDDRCYQARNVRDDAVVACFFGRRSVFAFAFGFVFVF